MMRFVLRAELRFRLHFVTAAATAALLSTPFCASAQEAGSPQVRASIEAASSGRLAIAWTLTM